MSKINFKKLKIYYFDIFSKTKYFKNNYYHTLKYSINSSSNYDFDIYANFNLKINEQYTVSCYSDDYFKIKLIKIIFFLYYHIKTIK